jgi:hypothetical protein
MASIYTHAYFIKNIIEKEDLHLNLKWAISGAIMADLDLLSSPTKKKHILHKFWHKDDVKKGIGIKFANKLLKESKNLKEKSFAIGFLSHFVLDKNVHKYLKDSSFLKHIQIEYYLERIFADNKLYFYFPKKRILEVYNKYFLEENESSRSIYKKIKKINRITILKFKITVYFIKKLVKSKYRSNKKNKILLNFIFTIASFKNKKLKSIYYPNIKYKKNNKYLIKILENTKKEFVNKYI